MASISLRSTEQILRSCGAKRVSIEACEVLREYLEGIAKKAGKKAVIYSKHAKRRTLMKDDINLAIDSLK
jgi:histone H3/H4